MKRLYLMRTTPTFSSFFALGLFVVGLVLLPKVSQAQQDAQFSQYMFQSLYYSPAMAGINDEYIELGVAHRTQWLGYAPTFDDGGAPTTQLFTFSMPIYQINSGVGLHMVRDQIGPVTSLEVGANYSYHHKLKNGARLSAGVRASFFNQSIDFSVYRPVDANDELIPQTGRENQFLPDFAAGIAYSTDRLLLGLSLNHLTEPRLDYGTQININSLDRHMTFLVGYRTDISDDLSLRPSGVIKSDLNTLSYEGSLMLSYQDRYFGGVSARASNALDAGIFLLGANALEDRSLRITYSFDYVTSGQTAKQPTSHEISLGYRLPAPKPSQRPVLRTPRYRF